MPQFPSEISNATVVITGASSGFGKGTALKLASAGANVVVAARRSDLLDELVKTIENSGGRALAVPTDVSKDADIKALAQKTVDTFGCIDVWINNVGVGALGYFWEIPLAVHHRVVDVNLTGLINGAHAALNQFMKQKGGTLVNVGSIDSKVPLAMQNTYAATKAAVLSLSRSLKEELRLAGRGDDIHVATIMPWAVDTPWWTHAANYTGHKPRMTAMDDPEIVVDAIVDACTHPKETAVGLTAKASNVSHELFPGLTERMSATLAKSESDKAGFTDHHTGTLFEPMKEGQGIEGGIRERMKQEDQ